MTLSTCSLRIHGQLITMQLEPQPRTAVGVCCAMPALTSASKQSGLSQAEAALLGLGANMESAPKSKAKTFQDMPSSYPGE